MTSDWIKTIEISLQERNQVELIHSNWINHYSHLIIAYLLIRSRTTTSSSSSLTADTQELAQTRHLLSQQYVQASITATRFNSLTEQLRKTEQEARQDQEELYHIKKEVQGLRERAKWWKEVGEEKERSVVILQDEHTSLTLELNQLILQNDALKLDNASLLSRWIEAKNEEVSQMNAENATFVAIQRNSINAGERGGEEGEEGTGEEEVKI